MKKTNPGYKRTDRESFLFLPFAWYYQYKYKQKYYYTYSHVSRFNHRYKILWLIQKSFSESKTSRSI